MRRRFLVCLLVLPFAAACTAPVRPVLASTLTEAGCVDGTTVDLVGAQGVIGAGPLVSNRDFWRTEPTGTKFWVASRRDDPTPTAHIVATRLDTTAEPVVEDRANPAPGGVPDYPLFFPGDLRLPEAGLWQITVQIGPDSGCFTVRAT